MAPAAGLTEVAGPVLDPTDAGYHAELGGFNTAATHEDAVVVGAVDTADVARAVRYAAARDRPVAVLATGHGGLSSRHAVVINTRRMTGCEIDPVRRVARVRAGTVWQEVISAAAQYGLAPLAGSSPTVGVVGYTIGGGLPILGREFGYAADHVRSIEVVTADGERRRASPGVDDDLFWAQRGGRGSFGVVTAMEFELMGVSRLYGGHLVFADSLAGPVLHAFGEWTAGLPDSAATSVAIVRLPDLPAIPPPLRGTCTAHLRFAYTGDATEGERLFAPMRSIGTPLVDTIREMPYSDLASINDDPTEPAPIRDDGCLLGELTDEAVAALLAVAGPRVPTAVTAVELRLLGGALGRPPAIDNAVGHRDAAYAVTIIGALAQLPEPVSRAIAEVITALEPWSTGGLAPNAIERGPGISTGRAWSPPVYERLQHIKRRYDPRDLFRSGYTVRPAPPPH